MTERERLEVSEMKITKCQEQNCRCGVCGKPITPYNLQLAHRVPSTKGYLKKYGKQIIHHDLNLVAVCSLKCNDAVLLSPKTHPIEANELIEKIRRNYERWKKL